MVGDVHATERTSTTMTTDIVAIYNVAVGEDMGMHAFGTKFAIALGIQVRPRLLTAQVMLHVPL